MTGEESKENEGHSTNPAVTGEEPKENEGHSTNPAVTGEEPKENGEQSTGPAVTGEEPKENGEQPADFPATDQGWEANTGDVIGENGGIPGETIVVVPEKDTVLPPDSVSGGIYKVTEKGIAVTYMEPSDKKQTTVTIPATVTIDHITYKVTSVSNNAFKNNKSIKKVTIGSNITTIGKNAFSGCSKLQTVTIGKKVTTIGEKAFYKNTSLKKIVIPASVKKIGAKAFYGCKKIKTVTIKTNKLTAKKVGSQAFKGINKKVGVKVPKKQKKAYTAWLRKRGIAKTAKIK